VTIITGPLWTTKHYSRNKQSQFAVITRMHTQEFWHGWLIIRNSMLRTGKIAITAAGMRAERITRFCPSPCHSLRLQLEATDRDPHHEWSGSEGQPESAIRFASRPLVQVPGNLLLSLARKSQYAAPTVLIAGSAK
jgi:hypothetical protein